MTELGLYGRDTAVILRGDNQSAIAVCKNGIKSERTKHIDIKYHFITDRIKNGELQLEWIPTDAQLADIFTKALGKQVFVRLREQIMIE